MWMELFDHHRYAFTISLMTAILGLIFYIWLRQRHSYWRHFNIPFVQPIFPFGNLKDLLFLRLSFGEFFQKLYNSVEDAKVPVVGTFWLQRPALVVRHPELIRMILIKNFNMFLNRFEAADPIHDSFGSLTLPLSKYPIWRQSRKRMSEFFTSGNIKNRMYPLMLDVSFDLENHIARKFEIFNHVNISEVIIEVKELCSLYTTDLTASLSCTSSRRSLKEQFEIREALILLLKPNLKKAFHFFMLFFMPHQSGWARAKVFPKDYIKFIQQFLDDNLKKRFSSSNEKTKNYFKDDLIDLLLDFKKEAQLEQKYQFVQHPDFIASQVGIMLLAGFETSSSTIAFILYELAKQPALQRRLRQELREYLKISKDTPPGTIAYDDLLTMPYLQMVVAEGLRKYPAAAFINRECTPEPGQTGFSLQPYVDFEIPSGMPAYISILGLHRDEQFWPNPEVFDPERFRPDLLSTIHPMTYIPFGAGPHGCIGSRLGLLQVKLGLTHILKNYRVEGCLTTPDEIKFEQLSFMLQNKGGIDLTFIKDSLFLPER